MKPPEPGGPVLPRYAVLHALDGDNLPIGLAIERRGYVHIDILEEEDHAGLPERIDEEYHVRQRDLSVVTYRPGDAGYFDQVLVELTRTVVVGEQDVVEDADWATILCLLHVKVLEPRLRGVRGHYHPAHASLPLVTGLLVKRLPNPFVYTYNYKPSTDEPRIFFTDAAQLTFAEDASHTFELVGSEGTSEEPEATGRGSRGRHRVAA